LPEPETAEIFLQLMRCLRTPNLLLYVAPALLYLMLASGCAQVGMPTGGPKDTIPPRLLSTLPPEKTTNFTGNKILLEFNEYIELKDIQKYLQVSPYPKSIPVVSNKLKTITVKLKDRLLPNTTYALYFGESITDLNEGNPFRDYTYVFSTGSTLDSLELSGKVILAESGMADSTLVVVLHRNAPDSAIEKSKPNYVTTVKGDGSFRFRYLPSGKYRVYALKDNDGSKTYNAPTELFGFLADEINLIGSMPPVSILAYAAEKEKERPATPVAPSKQVNALTYTTSLTLKTQPLQSDLELYCNNPLVQPDLGAILLTDTSGNRISGYRVVADSTQKTVRIQNNWLPGFPYRLIIPRNALRDSAGRTTLKTDTLAFKTKSKTDYGKVVIRFNNYNKTLNPVIQFWQAQKLFRQQAVNAPVWTEELFEPGEYAIRILYDENKNGRWDPGDYKLKRQPEKVIASDKKLNVKAEWDNELELDL
jgi:uncharacterized protein (DUF2141 family)